MRAAEDRGEQRDAAAYNRPVHLCEFRPNRRSSQDSGGAGEEGGGGRKRNTTGGIAVKSAGQGSCRSISGW